MLKLTLDTNCIIALEEERPYSEAVRDLLVLQGEGVVTRFIGAISGSENSRKGHGELSYERFAEKLNALGPELLPQVLPGWHLGMTYLGHMVMATADDLAARVQSVIHPEFAPDYETLRQEKDGLDAPIHRKRRNMRCDVQAMVAHIRNGHDVFVTEDHAQFVGAGRCDALVALGAGDVLTPRRALERLRADTL